MSGGRWLDFVLARHGIVMSAAQVDALAMDLRESIPVDGKAVAAAIRDSAERVLRQRSLLAPATAAVVDIASVAREIGNNAAASVVLELQVPPADEAAA